MTDAMLAGPSGFSRLDRRKARTRQAFVDAAVQLIAEGRGDRASIQEITERLTSASGRSTTTSTARTSCSRPRPLR